MSNSELKSQKIWRSMFRIVDCMRMVNNEVKDKIFYKLTYNQLRMLHRVYVFKYENNGQGISLKVLAERLGITPAAASEMVDTLVRKGVLTRCVDSNDRRAISIGVAAALQERFLRSEAHYGRMTAEFLETLPDAEQALFVETLNKFEAYANAKCPDIKETQE